jgi:hypothetical protein
MSRTGESGYDRKKDEGVVCGSFGSGYETVSAQGAPNSPTAMYARLDVSGVDPLLISVIAGKFLACSAMRELRHGHRRVT